MGLGIAEFPLSLPGAWVSWGQGENGPVAMAGKFAEGTEELLGGARGVSAFRRALVDWFCAEGRDYPWRRTSDPYAILVSEAMLQQTQIATVLGRGYYERWMRAVPDWESLAAASEVEVLKLWEGLGYYNRARNLKKAAEVIVRECGGRFPEEPEAILALPGVGRYTAGAVLSFAYDRPAPIVDGNVARVLARIFACGEAVDAPSGQKLLWSWAERLVPESGARLFNSGLMELGQRICRPSAPECPVCPVQRFCAAFQRKEVERYPVKRKRAAIVAREECVLLAERSGRIYLRPEAGTRRRGLWRLPEIDAEEAADLRELFRFEYPITRYRVTLKAYAAPAAWSPPEQGRSEGGWFALEAEEAQPPLGAPYRKALRQFWELRKDLDF